MKTQVDPRGQVRTDNLQTLRTGDRTAIPLSIRAYRVLRPRIAPEIAVQFEFYFVEPDPVVRNLLTTAAELAEYRVRPVN